MGFMEVQWLYHFYKDMNGIRLKRNSSFCRRKMMMLKFVGLLLPGLEYNNQYIEADL